MKTRDEERKARLAAALRENLKRRKAQARATAGTGAGVSKPSANDESNAGEDGPKDAAKAS